MNDATPEPLDAIAADMTPVDAADVDVRMRVIACPSCGISFAVPLAWHLSRSHGGDPVHCPNGCTWNAVADFDDAHARLLAMLVELATAKLDVRRVRIAAQRAVSGPAVDPSSMTDAEIDRRAKLLATRLPKPSYGQRQCTLCGSTFSNDHARNHLKKQHLAEIKAMPPSAFA